MELRRVILTAGVLAALALVFLTPPRVYIREDGVRLPASVCLRDGRPKTGNACWARTTLDVPKLMLQMVGVAVVTGALALAATPARRGRSPNPR